MNIKSRLYAIDMLRVAMMLLVVAAHSGLTYTITNFGHRWPIKDPRTTNPLFDLFIAFASETSMSLLFSITGFFTAMLYIEKGHKKMILNRLKRIVLPLLVGLLILYPVVFLVVEYFNLTVAHNDNIYNSLINAFNNEALAKFNTMHLWFLYFLSFYCITGWGISLFFEKISPKISLVINRYFGLVFRTKLAPVIFAAVTYLLFCMQKRGFIDSYINFLIDKWIFLQYLFFFAFGWLLYHQKEHLDRFKKGAWFFAVAGMVLFFVHIAVFSIKPSIERTPGLYVFAALKALSIWFLLFGFIGLFLKKFNAYSPIARYMSDASYWIYLVHLPIVVFFQAMLISFDINPLFKFLIVLSCTSIIVLLTYNYMVRNTLIGKFLNGRKYPPGLPNARQEG